ncbi:PKS-NRPS hybrid synthetase [Glycine max]|nr:PKS-NRPS hybrid synthetase [Glycine max]
MQQLMKLLERDQYIHWHRLKDEDVVCDIFWSHLDAVKLSNAYNLVFLIDSTYKMNRCRLLLLDIVGVTPTGMTFSVVFAYLEEERFRGTFFRHDGLPRVIVTDGDLALTNAVKIVFPESTNLLCQFHIDKNVKAECKTLGSLVDILSKQEFNECLMKFEIACSPWPMFVDYVKQKWLIPHKERFFKAWTNKVMHLGNTTTNRVESAH